MTERPPSPAGLPLLGNTVAFARDPFGFLNRAVAEHGDVVDLNVLGADGPYVLAHPAYVERVLVDDREAFEKTDDFTEAFGRGLVAVGGEEWAGQREFLQPLFYGDAIRAYADTMVECIERRVDRWEPGETRPVRDEMQALTLDVIFATLLGRNLSTTGDDARLREAADGLNARFVPTSWAPSPSGCRRRADAGSRRRGRRCARRSADCSESATTPAKPATTC